MKYGRLTYIEDMGRNNHGKMIWKCVCDCGNEKIAVSGSIKSGLTRSCGCLIKEGLNKKHGYGSRLNATKEQRKVYTAWSHIRNRCNNPNDARYSDWGGRGIRVCQRWDKFENFLEDMGMAPEGMSIDRIDNNGNYEKSNCRWATTKQQANNARSNIVLEYKGESKTVGQWAEHLGIKYTTLYHRIKRGLTIEESISAEPRSAGGKPKEITHNGQTMTRAEWAKKLGISPVTISTRLHRGWSYERALTK